MHENSYNYFASNLSAVQPHGLGRRVVKLLPVELRRPRLVLLLRVVRHAVVLPVGGWRNIHHCRYNFRNIGTGI